jgi:hypothetical protein
MEKRAQKWTTRVQSGVSREAWGEMGSRPQKAGEVNPGRDKKWWAHRQELGLKNETLKWR